MYGLVEIGKSRGSFERVQYLREFARCIPEVSITRARLINRSCMDAEGEPMIIRRAKALEKVLAEMPIMIRKGELIVGDINDRLGRSASIAVEFNPEWIEHEIENLDKREGYKYKMAEEDKKIFLEEILPYWRGKTTYSWALSLLPEHTHKWIERGVGFPIYLRQGICNVCVNIPKALKVGLNGLKREVEEKLKTCDIANYDAIEKILTYKAMTITLNAVINFAQRYAELARKKAREETDSRRRAELKKIAETCAWVPANPARTFYEALQSMWFILCALHIENYGVSFIPGRVDQYLYTYYKKDIEEGKLTKEEAKLLLELLYVKMNYAVPMVEYLQSQYWAVESFGFIFTLGGETEDGRDAVNELSYLILDADENVRLIAPELVIRVSQKNPDEWIMRAVEHTKRVAGKVKFINDTVAIQHMLNMGYDIKDARNYVLIGCWENQVPSKSNYYGAVNWNLAKMLELALNDGKDMLTGEQLGPSTGDPRDFKTIEDVIEAYKKQIKYFMREGMYIQHALFYTWAQRTPMPLRSSLIDGCIEKGLDVTRGGALTTALWHTAGGAPNVGDSLAVIKKLVFEDKLVTMDALLNALHKNFEGCDELLNLIEKVPRFGNDNDYVDILAKIAADIFLNEVQKYRDYAGGPVIAALGWGSCNIPMGLRTAALPDGRKAHEPLAEGGISPHQGRNVNGPTATFKSVAKIDHVEARCGSCLNMKFDPQALKDISGIRRLADMIRTFFDLGGYHVQFNIISTETLRDAQRNPEKYRDLLIRVATYSAYFVELSKQLQDDIIARVEFGEL